MARGKEFTPPLDEIDQDHLLGSAPINSRQLANSAVLELFAIVSIVPLFEEITRLHDRVHNAGPVLLRLCVLARVHALSQPCRS